MERGLLIELSPNEETALHRVAQGLMLTEDMQQRHLVRLKQLALIEETGTDFKLTVLGIQRLGIARKGAPYGRGLEGQWQARPSPWPFSWCVCFTTRQTACPVNGVSSHAWIAPLPMRLSWLPRGDGYTLKAATALR